MRKLTRMTLASIAAAGICAVTITAANASSANGRPASARPDRAKDAAAARAAIAHLRMGGAPVPMSAAPGAVRGETMVDSYNWSGYADIGATYNQVSATWQQPTVSCTNEDRIAAFWVGIDGYSTQTVEQTGTLAQCFAGQAYYYTWWEMYPTNAVQVVGITVRPGDRITSSVVRTGTTYTLSVTDASNSANSLSATQTCVAPAGCADSSVEWIGEAPAGPTGQYPLAQFGTWSVTNATAGANNVSGGITSFPLSKISMIDATMSYPLAVPVTLQPHGFTDQWDNSY